MKYVIIGVGAAGITAAEELRKLDKCSEITMVSEDQFVHSRCMLHKYISHERDEKTLNFTSEDFFEVNNIDWKKVGVDKIDTANKEVILLDGDVVKYDKLLIATGANSFIPSVGDFRKASNVFGLRHLRDAQAIDRMAEESEKILIVGSGLVGLDAAHGLLERGKDVTIVEMAPSILPVQLNPHAAEEYQRKFEDAGAKFYLGCKADKAECSEDGKIHAVTFDTGETVACDMIIVAAGVRPAVGFLEGSNVEVDRGIVVDDFMKTSVDDVYAAGDVAGLSGIWPNAMKQGKTAARNMSGMEEKYEDRFALKNTMNFYGLVTLCLGNIREEEGDKVVEQEDSKNYKKAVVRDGKLKGILLQGDISHSGIWQYIIKNDIDVDFKENIFDITFADFYGTGERGKYIWNY